jgi:hypothetical protein
MDDDDDEFSPSRASIWNKMYGQEKNPKDWTELRLALSYSVSEKRSLTHDDILGGDRDTSGGVDTRLKQQSAFAASTLATSTMSGTLAASSTSILGGGGTGLGSSSNCTSNKKFPKLKDSSRISLLLMGSKGLEESSSDRPSTGLPKSGKPMTKLEEIRYKAAKIKSLSERIKPVTTGKSLLKAKEAYLSLFPYKI